MLLISWSVYGPLATLIDRRRFRERPRGILLTFDDGPDPRYTPPLLDLLDEFDVRAIFFVLGYKVRRHPEIARDIIAGGHQVALHGARHLNSWWATPKQVRQNIRLGRRQLQKVGIDPGLYRPPYGRTNLAEDKTHQKMYWTKLFHDWDIRSPKRLLKQLKAGSRPGEIFLLHDGTEGRAKPDMPLVMIGVLRQWLTWARENNLILSDGRRWPDETT